MCVCGVHLFVFVWCSYVIVYVWCVCLFVAYKCERVFVVCLWCVCVVCVCGACFYWCVICELMSLGVLCVFH